MPPDACSRAARSARRTRTAGRCRTPTACAACRRSTGPCATPSPSWPGTVSVEMNSATDNPMVFADTRRDPLRRQLPRPARGHRRRHPRHRRRRARGHQRAPHRAPGQPRPVRPARLSRPRRRPAVRPDDGPRHRRRPGLREQGPRPPRQRRLDPHLRGQGGPRLDGSRPPPTRPAPVVANTRAGARRRAHRRRRGPRVPPSPPLVPGPRGGARAASGRAFPPARPTGSSAPTSRRPPARRAPGRSWTRPRRSAVRWTPEEVVPADDSALPSAPRAPWVAGAVLLALVGLPLADRRAAGGLAPLALAARGRSDPPPARRLAGALVAEPTRSRARPHGPGRRHAAASASWTGAAPAKAAVPSAAPRTRQRRAEMADVTSTHHPRPAGHHPLAASPGSRRRRCACS